MNEAEIARLEAGGNGNYTAFETFAMIGGPAMLVIGISVMACCPLWKGGARGKGNQLVEGEAEAV